MARPAENCQKVYVAALVSPLLRRAIEVEAATEGRSISNMVERFVGEALKARGVTLIEQVSP
jgi:hypothetical protein